MRVRGDLWALVKRALFYDLVELGDVEAVSGEDWFGVRSDGPVLPDAARRARSPGFERPFAGDDPRDPDSFRAFARSRLDA